MIPREIKNSSSIEMFKNKIRMWELKTLTANFIKIICIGLNVLTWLMTNPFVASVLILVIADPRDPFTYKLEGFCEHVQMW